MAPLATLQSATINAANLMGWTSKTGTLEPGKWADIIAVEKNPLDDVRVLQDVKFVMKAGVVYKGTGAAKIESVKRSLCRGVVEALRAALKRRNLRGGSVAPLTLDLVNRKRCPRGPSSKRACTVRLQFLGHNPFSRSLNLGRSPCCQPELHRQEADRGQGQQQKSE